MTEFSWNWILREDLLNWNIKGLVSEIWLLVFFKLSVFCERTPWRQFLAPCNGCVKIGIGETPPLQKKERPYLPFLYCRFRYTCTGSFDHTVYGPAKLFCKKLGGSRSFSLPGVVLGDAKHLLCTRIKKEDLFAAELFQNFWLYWKTL